MAKLVNENQTNSGDKTSKQQHSKADENFTLLHPTIRTEIKDADRSRFCNLRKVFIAIALIIIGMVIGYFIPSLSTDSEEVTDSNCTPPFHDYLFYPHIKLVSEVNPTEGLTGPDLVLKESIQDENGLTNWAYQKKLPNNQKAYVAYSII